MSETRTRSRIRKAVESRGHKVLTLGWEPIYFIGEMDGYGGGWSLTVAPGIYPHSRPDNDLYGMSVDELLAHIDYFIKPKEACDCDLNHNAVLSAGIINDPQKTTHAPDCKWHIKYRLRWWPDEQTQDAGTP